MRRVPRPRFLRAGLAFGFSLVDHEIHRKQDLYQVVLHRPIETTQLIGNYLTTDQVLDGWPGL